MAIKPFDVTKKVYFRPVIERILQSAPHGVYKSELMEELKLKAEEVDKVTYYLQSSGCVKILLPPKDYPETNPAKPTRAMIVPFYKTLLLEYKHHFTIRGLLVQAKDYGFLISILALVISIISILLSLFGTERVLSAISSLFKALF